MKHFALFFCIAALLFSTATLKSQKDSLFAFANAESRKRFAPVPVTNYKYDVAKSVFNELVMARGDRYKAVPKFSMNKGRKYMAWMNPIAVEIGMEERIYDVCTSFGADSLSVMAAVIAHELTHYYENHDWSRSFVSNHENLDASSKISALKEGIKFETQADYQGGMLAIAAGYDAYELMGDFLGKAYAAYGMPDQIPGYPSLAERQTITRETAAELKGIHAIYHTANYLTQIDAYEPALEYYERILNTFQSYEVYNNAGVTALQAVIQLMKPGEMPYALPLELDASSRLDKLATRLPDDLETRREMLMQKARNYLTNATNLTEKEAVSYLNMSIYYLMQKEYFDAEYWATKAQRLAIRYRQPKTSGDAQIVLGILAALDNRADEADLIFNSARAKSRHLAELNLSILSGEKTPPPMRSNPITQKEQLGNSSLENLLYDLPEMEVNVEVNRKVFCGKKDYPDHQLLLHFADDGEEYAGFQVTKADFSGATQAGIRMGSSLNSVLNKYGPADKNLNFRQGVGLRYEQQGIIFIFDAKNRLTHWVIYASNLE